MELLSTNWVEAIFNGERYEVAVVEEEEEDSNSCTPFEGSSRTTNSSKTACKSNKTECVYFLDDIDTRPRRRYKKTRNIPHEFYKLATLFIGDLLNAKVLPVTFGTSLQFFDYKKVRFFKVMVRGRIDQMYPHKDRYSIKVDDGTGRITCMFTNENRTTELKSNSVEDMSLMRDLFLQDRARNLLKANYVMTRRVLQLLNTSPSSCDLRCNERVTVIGNMKEHKEDRYIFIDKIRRENPNPKLFFEKNKEELLTYMYDHAYNLHL